MSEQRKIPGIRVKDGAAVTVTVGSGEKIRTFGGWYRHDPVAVDGVQVGFFQTRRRNKRTDTLTADMGQACVLGTDLHWLMRNAGVDL